jgi:CRISPR-associated protein Cmr6
MNSHGTPACRKALQNLNLKECKHAGLLLQRYLKAHKPKERVSGQKMPEEELLEAARAVKASEVYRDAFCRWKEWACKRSVHFTLELATPLAIGLGNPSPLEIGLTLHHTYGMPIIPGSALKGLCRRGARLLIKQNQLSQEQLEVLFGRDSTADSAGEAGYVVFYDALYDPDSVGGEPFHRDVITVHHPRYYGGEGEAPTDFDDPTPVPFLVIKPEARFLFALDTPKGWESFVKSLLIWCLCHMGVGAKTNAGYGYFKDEDSSPSSQASPIITAETQVWQKARLTYDAGRRVLKATADNLSAEAQQRETEQLLGRLPDDARQQILTRRTLQADVEIEILGNQRKIKRIIVEGHGD